MKRFHTQSGVSLVELLVALGILAVALTPLLSVFLHALKTSEHSNKRTIALNLVRDMQEEIRSKEFADPSHSNALAGASTIGFEETPFTGSRLIAFDDVDDYDGWCRGQDCTCVDPQLSDGRCVDNSALEAYDGTEYRGQGYPHYLGFTRQVQVYNIFPNVSTTVASGETRRGDEPREHDMVIGGGTRHLNFYDLRTENFKNLTGGATGTSRLKVIEVTVSYTGPTTPDIRVQDSAIIALPLSRER